MAQTKAETKDERRARLEAELRALEAEDREADISQRADDTSLGDVLGHLVAHSAGYPTLQDREVHARAVRREFGLGEYGPDEETADDQETADTETTPPRRSAGRADRPQKPAQAETGSE